jgi:Terminase large subunit, T4likevirus-type, N-terminal
MVVRDFSRLLDLPAIQAARCKINPVYMMEHAGITPDPWQARLLESQASRVLINCSRQVGKSTTVAGLSDHTILYKPGSLILLLSYSLRQSQELFRKCLEVYRALNRPVAPDAENALSLELEHGSRMVCLPGKEASIRSFSGVDLLIIDEASRVPDALYWSVRPMLAVSGGRLILLSTPFGKRGFFYEEYLRREQWDYYEIPATMCPRITPEFLAEERDRMGDYWFLQEYMCQFNEAEGSAFREEDILRIVSREVDTWQF